MITFDDQHKAGKFTSFSLAAPYHESAALIVRLVSLPENITTSNAIGRCFLSMMGAIHKMNLELRAERASTGRASAKAIGKSGQRPRIDTTIISNYLGQ